MTKTIFAYASALVLGAALTGCGHSDNGSPAAQTAAPVISTDTSSYIGGNCGDQVAQDYRRLSVECHLDAGYRTRPDDACRGETEEFLHKYPAVSCALADRGAPGERQGRRIEAQELRPILDGGYGAR